MNEAQKEARCEGGPMKEALRWSVGTLHLPRCLWPRAKRYTSLHAICYVNCYVICYLCVEEMSGDTVLVL